MEEDFQPIWRGHFGEAFVVVHGLGYVVDAWSRLKAMLGLEKICLFCMTVFEVGLDLHFECVLGYTVGSSCGRAVEENDQQTEAVANSILEIEDGPSDMESGSSQNCLVLASGADHGDLEERWPCSIDA